MAMLMGRFFAAALAAALLAAACGPADEAVDVAPVSFTTTAKLDPDPVSADSLRALERACRLAIDDRGADAEVTWSAAEVLALTLELQAARAP